MVDKNKPTKIKTFILVNNAGTGYTNLLHKTSLADWQQVINLNLTSVFQCIQGVLPPMKVLGQRTIVNLAFSAAHNTFPEWEADNVSKAGMVALSKALAAKERANGIRVGKISSGAVNTPIWDTATGQTDGQTDFNREARLTPEIVAQCILHTVLLSSPGMVEEMTVMPNGGAL